MIFEIIVRLLIMFLIAMSWFVIAVKKLRL